MSLAALREQLATVVAGTPSATPGLPTGLAALDALLPGGGLPPGRITELLAAPGFGKTTIARSLAATTIATGHCVAWIDATRTLDPRDFCAAETDGRTSIDVDSLWVVRPADPARAPWCADLLLRSGAFALVVLDGAPVLPRVVAVRLAQLAREADAALLLLGEGTRASEIGGALRLVMRRPKAITVEKGGPHQNVILRLKNPEKEARHGITGEDLAHRLRAHPEIPDRRGVAGPRDPRAAKRTDAAPSVARVGTRARKVSRARRFGQPDYPPR
jgi:hypothetical protein